jgi:hypothetical protein
LVLPTSMSKSLSKIWSCEVLFEMWNHSLGIFWKNGTAQCKELFVVYPAVGSESWVN